MRKPSSALAAVLALVLSSCGGGITVRNSGVDAPPKPKGCELEVLRKAPRDRPYEVLADLETHLTNVPEEGALAVVKPKACELGADAIIVVRNLVINEFDHRFVAVTAIKYTPPPAAPAETPAATPAPADAPAPGAGDAGTR